MNNTNNPSSVTMSIDGETIFVTMDDSVWSGRRGLNIVDINMMSSMENVVAEVEQLLKNRTDLKVLILLGSKRGVFSAGADILMLHDTFRDNGRDGVMNLLRRQHTVLNRFASLPIITVGIAETFALGGGLEVLLPCDKTVAVHGPVGSSGTELAFPEWDKGLFPAAGGYTRTRHLVDTVRMEPKDHFNLIYKSQRYEALEAHLIGLVDRVTASRYFGIKWAEKHAWQTQKTAYVCTPEEIDYEVNMFADRITENWDSFQKEVALMRARKKQS